VSINPDPKRDRGMDALAELLPSLGLGHWLIVAGILIVIAGMIGLLSRRKATGGGS
jgi:hypothetical protein